MYIDIVPNRNSPPAVLLRESRREGKKIKKRTLANLSALSREQVELLRRVLRGEPLLPLEERFQIVRSRPHGHVAAVLGTLRQLGLESLLASRPSRERSLVVAMLVARLLDPRSKLATARELREETLTSSLGELLGLGSADAAELYLALDWLLERQVRIEKSLAKRQLGEGTLVLYDVTSSYFEGHNCPLAQFGYSRDGKKGKLQVVFGLLCNLEGCPVAVEVFEGNTADPNTLSAAIEKLRGRFGLQQLVLVGDRGLLSEARISEELRPIKGLGWITALRAPQLKKLVQAGELSLSRLEEQGLLEFSSADLPGERLLACKNPRLAEERARKREELLQASERELDQLVAATRRSKRALRGKAKIALRLGRLLARFKVAKHFCVEIEDRSFSYSRNQAAIQAEAALDGIYVIRTDVAEQGLAAEAAVRSYKALSRVEQAFRSYKMDLKVRPIFHHLPKRVRAHIFLCMLAYFLEWHMRRALAPLLFDEHDPVAARARQGSVVNAAQRSLAAQQKALSKRTEDGLPVHSFQTLLADLATLSKNRVCMGEASFDQLTSPTPLQERVFELLGVSYRG